MASIKKLTSLTALLVIYLFGFTQQADQQTDDRLGIIVTQSSKYVLPGDMMEINVFPTCNSANHVKKVLIMGASISINKNGFAKYNIIGTSTGLHEVPIEVSFANSKGEIKYKRDTVTYMVGQANALIALQNSNVLYIGIDNRISVSASGLEKVSVTSEGGGSLVSQVGTGRYYVRVKTITDDCIISIRIDEKIVGAAKFKVRNLPVPIGTVGGFSSGDSISASAFTAQKGVYSYLNDAGLDLKYLVTSFTLNIFKQKDFIRSVQNQTGYFSPEAMQLMKDYLKEGTLVIIDNLTALAPDGKTVKLAPLIYHIK